MELFFIFIIGLLTGFVIGKKKPKSGNLLLARDNEGIYAFMELETDMEQIWKKKDITLRIVQKNSDKVSSQE